MLTSIEDIFLCMNAGPYGRGALRSRCLLATVYRVQQQAICVYETFYVQIDYLNHSSLFGLALLHVAN